LVNQQSLRGGYSSPHNSSGKNRRLESHLGRLLGVALLAGTLLVSACQQVPPVSINDIPVFPGAIALPPDSNTGEVPGLASALDGDMSYRKEIGAASHVSHKVFRLSKDPKYVNGPNLYPRQLQEAGWTSRWGWVPARQAYDRGSQTLTLNWFGDTLLMALDEDPNE
jgi:hypothetical protein